MRQPLRILHLSAQKPDSTGSGIYLRETVDAFSRMGAEQAVIAGIGPDDCPSFPEDVLFRPVVFETEHLLFPVVGMSDVMPYAATRYRDMDATMVGQFTTAFAQAIDEVLDQFVPDFVICHHLYLLCAVVAYRFAQRAQDDLQLDVCRVFGLSHSTDIRQMRQIPLERDFIKAGVRMLDGIFALHSQQADEICEVYGVDRQKVCVVGTGYNDRLFYRGESGPEGRKGRLVFVGKVCLKKGVASLLRAMPAVAREQPDVRLTLIGGHSNQAEYDAIVELANDAPCAIDFAGRVSNEQLVETYRHSDVFVLPSFYEGLPLVVVEALACGCKVVVTDLPGIRPWVQSNVPDAPVVYVKPPRMRDTDAPYEDDLPAFEADLAKAIGQALDLPACECDTSAATWDALCGRILNLVQGEV